MVLAIELDKRLCSVLEDKLKSYNNLKIIYADILKINIPEIVYELLSGTVNEVCANLPYNITSPVLTALFEAGTFNSITVMIQREVARRIVASPGSAQYGAFTVYVNYHSIPLILFDVSPDCFFPKPKVYSSVIKLNIRNKKFFSDPCDENLFFRVVRAAFGQRRKTLINSLYAVFNNKISKTALEGIISECGFDHNIRGEMLSLYDFIKLTGMLRF